jgi:hypothetical protein
VPGDRVRVVDRRPKQRIATPEVGKQVAWTRAARAAVGAPATRDEWCVPSQLTFIGRLQAAVRVSASA